MSGLNLHSLVRSMIPFVNPDEIVTIYHSKRQTNNKGKIIPIYEPPVTVQAQVQRVGDATLYHSDKVGQNDITKNFYLIANSVLPPYGLIRQLARGGDILKREDNTFWLVVAVVEDFTSTSGWVCVRGSIQVNQPNFSASPWYTGSL